MKIFILECTEDELRANRGIMDAIVDACQGVVNTFYGSFSAASSNDLGNEEARGKSDETGKWINGDCEGGNCSICGKYYAFYPESGDFNYCPNCGASMIKDGETE